MKTINLHEEGLLKEGVGKYIIEINVLMMTTLALLALFG